VDSESRSNGLGVRPMVVGRWIAKVLLSDLESLSIGLVFRLPQYSNSNRNDEPLPTYRCFIQVSDPVQLFLLMLPYEPSDSELGLCFAYSAGPWPCSRLLQLAKLTISFSLPTFFLFLFYFIIL